MCTYLIEKLRDRNVRLTVALALISGFLSTLLGTLLSDILYAVVDPRVRIA